MLQSRQVPVYAADEGIAGIVALGKRQELADVDETHVHGALKDSG